MKLVNTTAEIFVSLFGQEGLAMIEQYEGNVYLAKTGQFPQIEKYGRCGGCVIPVNPETLTVFGEGTETALILYPDFLIEDSWNVPEEMRPRYMQSVLVHELEHVKQVTEGRMEMVDFGRVIWEGEEQGMDMNLYMQFPWEREAHIAQFTYLLNNAAQGEQAYEAMAAQFDAANCGIDQNA